MLFFSAMILLVFSNCQKADAPVEIDREELLADLEYLASDALKGRFPETEGSLLAQEHIIQRFKTLGVQYFEEDYRHFFRHTNQRNERVFERAVNIIGYIEGQENPDQFIALSAHYDHLGEHDGMIYNGADDNASGVGGLLAAARHFAEHPPKNSLLFLAFDVEEQGLGGARYFVENPVVALEQIVMNINMDMISHNFENELYAVGTYHYPFLKPHVERATQNAPVQVLFGYDSDAWDQDWTFSSDHGPFHQKGVPFIYFGVEDHPHYHQPSDTFENTNPDFYVDAVYTILNVIQHIDRNLADIRKASNR